MDGWYWLAFLLVAVALAFYARHWYHRPSGIPETLKASYASQLLEYMDYCARREGHDSAQYEIERYKIIAHMNTRRLGWRERNDIINFMVMINWVYEVDEHGNKFYVITNDGIRELEEPDGLRAVVKESAQELHDDGISNSKARATAAAVIAAALRVDARSAPPESSRRAKDSADDLERAVRTRDPDKIDHAITRSRDVLQIVTLSLPFVRDILRILGSF